MAEDPFASLFGGQPASSSFPGGQPLAGLGIGAGSSSDDLTPEERAWLAGSGTPSSTPSASPTLPTSQHGPIRRAWEGLTSPLRAIAGLTGTSLVSLASPLYPEAYRAAHEELKRSESGRAGPELLGEAASLPGLGDVAAQAFSPEARESTAGHILEPVGRLAGNILGDPLTYVGGLGAYTRVGRAAGALGKTQEAIKALTEAGRVEEAAELSARLPSLAGAMAEAAGLEARTPSALERVASVVTPGSVGRAVAEGNVGRVGLAAPFSPLVGIAYAPDIIEGVADQAGSAFDAARAGRYADAAASGTGALLTAGLGALVAKGVIHEVQAGNVLKRAMAEKLGEREVAPAPAPTEVPPVAPPAPPPEAAPATPPAAEAVAAPPGPGPKSPPVNIPATPAAPATLEPTPGSEKIRITRTAENDQKLADLVTAKTQEGQYLTKRDLISSGLVTAKQAKSYPLEALLDALGGTHFRSRLEPVEGFGFRVRAGEPGAPSAGVAPGMVPGVESVPAGAAVPAVPPAPGPTVAVPKPAAGMEVPQPAAAAPAPPPTEPLPRPVPHAATDTQLANPEVRAAVEASLQDIAQRAGVPLDALNRAHVAATFPNPEHKPVRALLMRSLEAGKAARRAAAREAEAAGPQPALTFPGEARQPERTPRELMPEQRQEATGLLGERGRPTGGIGEATPPAPAAEPAIRSQAELDSAREELRSLKLFVMSHPHVRDEFAPDIIRLEDNVMEALHRGVGAPPMPPSVRSGPPTPPEPQPYTGEGPTHAPRSLAEGTLAAPPPELLHRYVRAGARPRAEALATAVRKHLEVTGTDPATFAARARDLTGVSDLSAVSPEQLSLLFTLADKNPKPFGTALRPIDPQLAGQAAERLTGTTAHLGGKPGPGVPREFAYDPASPAGRVQEYARALEAGGFSGAEDRLQETMMRWISGLSQDDERFTSRGAAEALAAVQKGAQAADAIEATDPAGAAALRDQALTAAQDRMALAQRKVDSAKNLRRLLLGGEEGAGDELYGLLRRSLTNDSIDFRRSKAAGAENLDMLVARSAVSGMEGEPGADVLLGSETARPGEAGISQPLRATPSATGGVKGVGDESTPPATLPPRPADVKPGDWVARIKSDPELLGQVTAAISGASKAGGRGVASERMTVLRQLAADVGIEAPAKQNAEKLVARLAKVFRAPEPQAASDLLSNQIVTQRGPAWRQAISRGAAIGDTGARVVDFEGDASPLVRPLAASSAPLAESLSRATADLSARLNMPSRFGGMVASPQLQGLRMTDDGSVFLNPLHARSLATASLADSSLSGDALRSATDYKTAKSLTDVLFHEVVHQKALHDAAAGDVDFITAYANAIRQLGPVYEETIRSIRDGVEASRGLDALSAPYARAVDSLKGRLSNAGSLEGPSAGPGGGGTPAVGYRQGEGPGGAPGGPETRLQPGGAVRGGTAEPAPAVRATPIPVEGAPGGGTVVPGEAGPARGPGGGGLPPAAGTEPSASLTGTLTAGLRERQRNDVLDQIRSRFAQSYAKFSGSPEDAQKYLGDLEAIKGATPDLREELRTAKPGGKVDVGLNLLKIPSEAMSDEQKEQLGLALMMRNHTLSRATPMTEKDVRSAFSKILDTYTPEEFINMAKAKGLRDPADFAFLETVASTFGQDVDTARGQLTAANIEMDAAKLSKNTTAQEAAAQRMQQAQDLLQYSVMKRDAAIFTLIPESTRVARALAFRRLMFHPLLPEETFRSRFYGAMRASSIKKDKADQFYKMFQDTVAQGPAANWTEFTNAFRRATEPRFFDKFLEFWKAGLLGIPTQITNIGSNAMFFGLRNAENAVSNLANRFFAGLTGKPRERFVGETSARMLGGAHGFSEAWSSLKSDLGDMARLVAPDPSRRLSQGTFFDDPNLRQMYGAIGGKTGEFVRIPFKLLDSFDNFFKHVIRNQEWAAQSNRLAQDTSMRSPGEAIPHATARIYDEIRRTARDPLTHSSLFKKYRSALEAGRNMAIEDTFQAPLAGNPIRDAAKSFQRATNQLPALQLLVPFMKTPYNILAEAMKRTPVAAAWTLKKYMRGEITDPAFVEAMVKSSIGTMLMGTVLSKALDGTITGGGPTDPKQAEMLKRTGWQPRSIKVGSNYFSYARLAPFSILMGIGADMGEAYARKDIDTASELLHKGVASATDNVMNQTFISGLDSLMKILTDPERSGLSALRSLEASLVPNIIGVVPFAHAARGIDPNYRETSGNLLAPMQAQVPFASTLLPEQLTPTGEPRERKGTPLERVFSPIARSTIETGPIAEAAAEIARVGPAMSAVPVFFRVGNDRVYYTPEERQEIALAQQRAMEKVAGLIQTPGYASLPDQKELATAGQRSKRDAIEAVIERYHGPVSARINKQAMRRAKLEETASAAR